MVKFKIIKETYTNSQTIYRVKRKHPWFGFWMYVGNASDRMFFTTLNYYQTAYHSYEDAHRRVMEYRKYLLNVKNTDPIVEKTCKTFNFETE